MTRPFVPYPDKRLSTVAAPVAVVDDEVRAIWDDMIEAMLAMPGHGVGLAAVQIGVMRALAVVDCSEARNAPVRLANPEILRASVELSSYEEGSPNLPGVSAKVRRPQWVEVGYIDGAGAPAERRFEGLWATSVQHQIDHLAGRMFFDRLSKVKRDMVLRKARKART